LKTRNSLSAPCLSSIRGFAYLCCCYPRCTSVDLALHHGVYVSAVPISLAKPISALSLHFMRTNIAMHHVACMAVDRGLPTASKNHMPTSTEFKAAVKLQAATMRGGGARQRKYPLSDILATLETVMATWEVRGSHLTGSVLSRGDDA
jgi:hypothetical protein